MFTNILEDQEASGQGLGAEVGAQGSAWLRGPFRGPWQIPSTSYLLGEGRWRWRGLKIPEWGEGGGRGGLFCFLFGFISSPASLGVCPRGVRPQNVLGNPHRVACTS